jgi:hypothetical protein
MQKKHLFFVLVFIGFMACNIPRQQILRGNYDDAITTLCRKLSRKPNKDENIILLERAYLGAQQRDLDRIDYLRKENSATNWITINDIYKHIQFRQNQIRPLLPLRIASLKRNCNITLIDVNDQIINSGNKAAEFYYNEAQSLLKTNSHLNARKAYSDLMEIKNYPNQYTDVSQLLVQAKQMGINHVLFRMRNVSNEMLPIDFEKDLLKISLQELNGEWIQYNTTQQENTNYDFEIIVRINKLIVSPEQNNEVNTLESKEIQDGWEYELDAKGNVKKDSLGNDIKHPKMKKITCDVKETNQLKTASIMATLDYVNLATKQLMQTFPLQADAVFENKFVFIHGDQNALSEATKAKLKSKPMPFPTNLQILDQCGNTLKPSIKTAILQHRGLVEN